MLDNAMRILISHQEMERPGRHLDARTGQTQQIQHRVIVYDNHQATAQSGSDAEGELSDRQMDQDTRLVSAILDLLTGDAGTLIQQATIEGDTTIGPDDPPRWRWERQGKSDDPIPVEPQHSQADRHAARSQPNRSRSASNLCDP